jgi:hypothetical protein
MFFSVYAMLIKLFSQKKFGLKYNKRKKIIYGVSNACIYKNGSNAATFAPLTFVPPTLVSPSIRLTIVPP